MRHSAILLVLLLAMLWQSVGLARFGSTVTMVADLEHAALHVQVEGHHHHEDGSFHVDDSQASALHLLSDHATPVTALLPALSRDFQPSPSFWPGGLSDDRVPDPFLDGLLRPPRLHA